MRKYLRKVPARLRSKKALLAYAGFAAMFVLVNVVLAVVYHSKTYPNTYVAGKSISNVHHNNLANTLDSIGLVPESVTLKYRDTDTSVQAADLGIRLDTDATSQTVKAARSWLPLWSFLVRKDVSFDSDIDNQTLSEYLENFANKHRVEATNAKITLKDGEFDITAEKAGHTLDLDSAKQTIIDQIANGHTEISLEPQTVDAKITKEILGPKLEAIKKQQQTSITLKFGSKSKTFSPGEIAAMFDTEDGHAELADANIQAAVTRTGQGFGILVENVAQAVAAIKQAISENQALTFTLIEKPKPTLHYTYCVSARGVPTSHLGGLSAKLASVFADNRGWGLKKQITFSKVASGCNFTVWLSAASQMPTFGAICDAEWSCRVGSNVVINFNRWQGATTAWNNAGGSLENYRVMVINHEVGHWFGYYHAFCGGAGQLAPIMQQQSINLQGCTFNPWPTAGELASHRRSLGL